MPASIYEPDDFVFDFNDAGSVTNGDGSKSGGEDTLDTSKLRLSQDETKSLVRLKIGALLVLIVTALGFAMSVFFLMISAERNQFVNQFQYDANKVLESVGTSTSRSLGILDSYSVVASSYTNFGSRTFPNITIPDFAIRAAKYRSACGGIIFSHLPIVTADKRVAWEAYAWNKSGDWVNTTKTVQVNDANHHGGAIFDGLPERQSIYDIRGNDIPYNETRMMLPQWINYPTYNPSFNYDWLSGPEANSALRSIQRQRAVMSEAFMLPDEENPEEVIQAEEMKKRFAMMVSPGEDPGEPVSNLIYPIIFRLDKVFLPKDSADNNVVAIIAASIYWRDYLKRVLSEGSNGIVVVVENPCNPSFTYQIDGPNSKYLGRGDKHDIRFDHFKVSRLLHDLQVISSEYISYSGVEMDNDYCPYTVNIYPSKIMQDKFSTKNPVLFTVGVLILFMFVGSVFFVYDWSVEHRQQLVVDTATKTNAIVSSLFPKAIRDQLIETEQQKNSSLSQKTIRRQRGLTSINPIVNDELYRSQQMAHLYPDTTVLFADFAGFTAWSSSRNPNQVFMLLETVYGAFDKIAKSRKVFKVETIGDCYVAATGLPDEDKKHAVRMVQFAAECLENVSRLVIDLITVLGPETADLDVRIGINSGPTTAGVLRGDKARFQLFGDTVNQAARMENTGKAGRIHASQKTVDFLIAADKKSWVTERIQESGDNNEDKTYWVHPNYALSASGGSGRSINRRFLASRQAQETRMVDWNADVLLTLLKQIIGHRTLQSTPTLVDNEELQLPDSGIPLNELSESIKLPSFSTDDSRRINEMNIIRISTQVASQLRNLIKMIDDLYLQNEFHNFEHACHVVMSTTKLLSRISHLDTSNSAKDVHKQTTLDPLTQFAIVFSALIHDVDHRGVSNFQLIQENAPVANRYRRSCVAEQNSIDVAWNALMQPSFRELRQCIASTADELKHFRKVLVLSVLSTDIFDENVKKLGEKRWNRTFTEPEFYEMSGTEVCPDRKAAIIIELVMQTSDVCHTMQHWKIYQKWNEKLFNEMYVAYLSGRSQNDPSEGWYVGELWFFDNYIIPLAKKLKICGVFGVSCDEFLDYATDNRIEWELKGREITREFSEKAKAMWDKQEGDESEGMMEF